MVGFFGLHEGGQSIAPAAGMTEQFDRTSTGANLTLEAGDQVIATAGVTGERQATASFADTSVAQLIALSPASGPPANIPPTVSITSPANNATFTAPATITISATASDSDGTISKVEFFHGSTLIGTDTLLPYEFVWNNVAAGSYALKAVATDNASAVATSTTVNITVSSPTGGSSGWTDTGAAVVLTDAADRVGVGTSSPAYKLDVAGQVRSSSGGFVFPDSTVQTTAFTSSAATQWTTTATNLFFNTGNVGVGTSSPAAKLEVVGTNGVANNTGAAAPDALKMTGGTGGNGNWNGGPGGVGGALHLQGGPGGIPVSGSDSARGGFGGSVNITGGTGGTSPFVASGTGGSVFLHGGVAGNSSPFGANGNVILANVRGFVGVGTTSPAYQLDVAGTINASNFLLNGAPFGGGGDSQWTTSDTNIFFNTGNVGIGTSTPINSRLHIASPGNTYFRISAPLGGQSAIAFNDDTNGQDIVLYRPNGTRDFSVYTTTAGNALNVMQGGNVGIGTFTPSAKLHVAGDILVDGNIAAKYQDVAEWVPSRQLLSAATVVVLDPSHTNHVLASATPYDLRVAGVVSAQPGITLGERGEGKLLIATTGRVRIKVDATRAPIMIGDLLVTSGIEGFAMRSDPLDFHGVRLHRPGTIIGKALEPLAKGTGEILVLLSMQ
ncbi:MAG: Ig-like domain-containing protein [Acidobacteriota bacterium]|nr:Ig-like domain-containing protein [Acidobacteriota bacterium]